MRYLSKMGIKEPTDVAGEIIRSERDELKECFKSAYTSWIKHLRAYNAAEEPHSSSSYRLKRDLAHKLDQAWANYVKVRDEWIGFSYYLKSLN